MYLLLKIFDSKFPEIGDFAENVYLKFDYYIV